MFPNILPIRAPRRPARELIRRGLARLGIDLPHPVPVTLRTAGVNRWWLFGIGLVPTTPGATDAELARLARCEVMDPADRVRWNAVAPFYGGDRLRG